MSRRNEHYRIEIPDVVTDAKTNTQYKKGKFLGRGGFAKYFELIDTTDGTIYAGKVVAKSQVIKSDLKDRMTQEIKIHRKIRHNHIVEFHSYFTDKDYIYIVLELCSKRSLMEMHKRRKQLNEIEIRYYVRQICLACKYLHARRIVHRNLKLANLFLTDNMELKVGDFGWATRIATEGDPNLTLCGTPNYIAPEVLCKKGHSYEVDVWSLGCIVYTLAVGKTPFETNDLKDTYKRIKNNDYKIPNDIPEEIAIFIRKLLQADPDRRPSMVEILNDPYMRKNYIPSRLPTSCLTVAPRSIDPLSFLQNQSKSNPDMAPKDFYLEDLSNQLHHLINSRPSERAHIMEDEAEDPASAPIFWISKWTDSTDKCFAYELCENSVGVLFDDSTTIMFSYVTHYDRTYIERDGTEKYHKLTDCKTPEESKKSPLMFKVSKYIYEHWGIPCRKEKPRDGDDLVRFPHLNKWFRTDNAIVFQLSNGSVQVNFFEDDTKLILCPLMGSVTYINPNHDFKTYKFNFMSKYGCAKEVDSRLRYATEMVERLILNYLMEDSF